VGNDSKAALPYEVTKVVLRHVESKTFFPTVHVGASQTKIQGDTKSNFTKEFYPRTTTNTSLTSITKSTTVIGV
jgi:hypothetical protein